MVITMSDVMYGLHRDNMYHRLVELVLFPLQETLNYVSSWTGEVFEYVLNYVFQIRIWSVILIMLRLCYVRIDALL